jgi:hypothetical protein
MIARFECEQNGDGGCRGGFKPAPTMPPDLSEMPAAIVWGKRRKDGTPAIRADLAFDHNATVGTYEIRTASAAFVSLRAVLISSGGLGQFLLILRLVLLRRGSSDAATGRCRGRNAHCFDKSSARRSGSRHGCPSLAPGFVTAQAARYGQACSSAGPRSTCWRERWDPSSSARRYGAY